VETAEGRQALNAGEVHLARIELGTQ
jgi:hypothetical protein